MEGDKLYAACGSKLLCINTSDEAVAKAKEGKATTGRFLSRDAGMAETKAVNTSPSSKVEID